MFRLISFFWLFAYTKLIKTRKAQAITIHGLGLGLPANIYWVPALYVQTHLMLELPVYILRS